MLNIKTLIFGALTILGLLLYTSDESLSLLKQVSTDRQALMDLYEATGGENWTRNSGWGDGAPSNRWYGVEVDAEGRVVRLDLFDNGLRGQLPESIGQLSKMRYFNVKHNRLTGPLPASLGNLTSVEWLSLAGPAEDPTIGGSDQYPMKYDWNGNTFTGRIPPELGNLPNVLFIELSRNDFSGGIPPELGNARTLRGLYLNYNGLTGRIPASLGNLSNLIELQLHGGWGRSEAAHTDQPERFLSGELPPELGNLHKLEVLRIGGNTFSGQFPESYKGMRSLRHFVAQKTGLGGRFPFEIFNSEVMPELATFYIPWNEFSGGLPNGLDYSTHLAVFDIGRNNFSGSLPDWVTKLRPIIFNVGWNNFTGEIPQNGWDEMERVRYLRFNDNEFSGSIPEELPRSDNLEYLYFHNNKLSGSISPNHRIYSNGGRFPEFEYMDISGNRFSNSDYGRLRGLLGGDLRIGDQNP